MKKVVSAANRNSSPSRVDELSTLLSGAQSNTVITVSTVDDKCVTREETHGPDLVIASANQSRISATNGIHAVGGRSAEVHSHKSREGLNNCIAKQSPDVSHPLVDQFGPPRMVKAGGKEWDVRANPLLTASVNPIRSITDALVLDETNGKDFISLAQGDPAKFGPHMRVPEVATSALVNVVQEGKNNGYTLSTGLPDCRIAVADFLSAGLHSKISARDVIITSGCSQAIQHSIDALRFPGCNILLPKPGFPLYETVCKYFAVEVRHYDLLEDKDWEVDLAQVAALADGNTAALIVCNPGNPSGSVFGYKHLSQIANVAETLKVPIIADEVYSSLVFGKTAFVPMGTFSSKAPVISVGGVSKNWLAPGWRLGWLAVWDPHGILRKARVIEAVTKIMQITLGASTLMQAAVPQLLRSTPLKFFEQTRESLRQGAELCYARANTISGLDCPSQPQGSMFMMIRMNASVFEGIKTDVEFSAALLKEESVLVLPGTAFGCSNWFRIVFALTLSQQNEAWDRIEEFCARHALGPR